jgi:hypothetical protein
MHAYPCTPHDDYDLDDEDPTLVQESPYLALMAAEAEEAAQDAPTTPLAEALCVDHTVLAMGYPSPPIPIQHTFTEPLRGYPEGAAYVPRHDETGLHATFAAPATVRDYAASHHEHPPAPVEIVLETYHTPSLPKTEAMPAVTLGTPLPPRYGHNVVALPAAGPEASQPLVVDEGGAIEYAHRSSVQAPAPSAGSPRVMQPAPRAESVHGGRALFGALLGALAGALLWGAVGYLTGGYELKYGAILIGLFTGAGAAGLGGGHSKGVGALGAVFGLAGILMGKVLFEILVQPHLTFAAHIAYHTTPIDLVFYGATVVTGFAVGAGTLSPSAIISRGRAVLRRFSIG